jgi:general secretion pathway protein C
VANDASLMESQAPRILPNYVNGQPTGFRLQGIRSGSIFSAIGIRNGDVIVGVNGTDINSPQRAMELYQAMLQQDQVEMQILRRGREHTLNYTIK